MWDNCKALCSNLSSPHSHPCSCLQLVLPHKQAVPKSAGREHWTELNWQPRTGASKYFTKNANWLRAALSTHRTLVLWHGKLCHSWTGNCKGLLHFSFKLGSSPRSSAVHSLIPGIKIRPCCKCEKSHLTVIYADNNKFWLQID